MPPLSPPSLPPFPPVRLYNCSGAPVFQAVSTCHVQLGYSRQNAVFLLCVAGVLQPVLGLAGMRLCPCIAVSVVGHTSINFLLLSISVYCYLYCHCGHVKCVCYLPGFSGPGVMPVDRTHKIIARSGRSENQGLRRKCDNNSKRIQILKHHMV